MSENFYNLIKNLTAIINIMRKILFLTINLFNINLLYIINLFNNLHYKCFDKRISINLFFNR